MPDLTGQAFKIWGAPITLACVTALGLLSALLADGWADALSWLALAVPVAVMIWFVRPRRDRRT